MGHVAWNKGIPQTEEVKRKLSLAHKGKKHAPCSEERKRKIGLANKGRHTKRSIIKSVIIRCVMCGKEFSEYPSRIKEGKNNFCSKTCYIKSQSGRMCGEKSHKWSGGKNFETKCKQCGKSIFHTKCQKRVFCCVECEGKWYSLNKTGANAPTWRGGRPKCPVCNKEIYPGAKTCQKHKPKTSKETRQKQSLALRGKMPKNTLVPGKSPGRFKNIIRGYFLIGDKDMFFRSKWEANYALYLNFLVEQKQIEKWEYEVDVFIFEKIQFGTRSYRPDFKVFNNDKTIEYHEIKGYMDAKSKTKLNRMRIYYPDTKVVLIDQNIYKDIIKKLKGVIKFY